MWSLEIRRGSKQSTQSLKVTLEGMERNGGWAFDQHSGHCNEKDSLTEIMWPPKPWAASAHSITALSWGYPTPVFLRVVHTEPEEEGGEASFHTSTPQPFANTNKHLHGLLFQLRWCQVMRLWSPGPMPTLMMSAPARISSSTISPVTTFPAWEHFTMK